MQLYLSGNYKREEDIFNSPRVALSQISILKSYYYLRMSDEIMKLEPLFESFMLDSGAFTFLRNSREGRIDWDAYVEEYAAFIVRWKVNHFFELDIDSLVGLKEVERLRAKLERLTGKQSIPVWHVQRGKDSYIGMCNEYPYIALGGIAIKEIPPSLYEEMFPWFITEAHQRGTKIHGLGYTSIAGLHKFHFDSVDSTAWLYGNRGGYIYTFDEKTGQIEQNRRRGMQVKSRETAVHNFFEWVRFGIYLKKY